MSDELCSLFREIHRLRRFGRDLQDGIDRYPRALKTQKGRVTHAEEQLKEAQDAIKKLKVTQHQKEVDLKARETQLDRSQKKLAEAGSQKEFDALNSEIAQGKEACGHLEEEILTLMGEIEERTAGLPKYEQDLATVREEYARFETAATAKKVEQEGLLKQALLDLTEVEKRIPASLADQYHRCIKSKGADALSLVKNRVCSACSTAITNQQNISLQNNQFVTCNSCGRILYLGEPAPVRDDDD